MHFSVNIENILKETYGLAIWGLLDNQIYESMKFKMSNPEAPCVWQFLIQYNL